MKNIFEFMKKCPLFSGMTDDELTAVLENPDTKIQNFSKNQTVTAEGSNADFVGIILSGSVHIIRNDYYGNRSIIAHIDSPQIFAEVFAFSKLRTMPVSVISASDSSIMFIKSQGANNIPEQKESYAKLTNNLLHIVTEKNLKLNEKIEIVSRRTIRKKLMAFLLSQAKQNNSDTFTIPYDRQALADFLEADRSALSAEISKLRAEGIIESHKSKFRLIKNDQI